MSLNLPEGFARKGIWKLASLALGLGMSLVTAGLVPRALGPADFGRLSFAIVLFTGIIQFMELRTASHFLVRNSRSDERVEGGIYAVFALLVGMLVAVVATVFATTDLEGFLLGESWAAVFSAAGVYATLAWWQDLLGTFLDAKGKTVRLEILRLSQRIIVTAGLLGLRSHGGIGIVNYFLFVIGTQALFLALLGWVALRESRGSAGPFLPNRDQFRSIGASYFRFAMPSAGYVALVSGAAILDRWLLHRFAGADQQGIYAFSNAFMVAGSLALTAMTPLVTRELALARDDANRLREVYHRFHSILFALTSCALGFLMVNIPSIIELMAGPAYRSASMTVRLLLVIPMLEAMFGINACLVYATGNVRIFFKSAIFVVPSGIALLVLLLAHGEGADALAQKNGLMTFVGGMVLTVWASRRFGVEISRFVSVAMYAPVFLGLSWIATYLAGILDARNGWVRLCITGSFYAIGSMPVLLGSLRLRASWGSNAGSG